MSAKQVDEDCRPMTLKSIKRVYDTKGASGLTKASIDYYNRCIDAGKWQ